VPLVYDSTKYIRAKSNLLLFIPTLANKRNVIKRHEAAVATITYVFWDFSLHMAISLSRLHNASINAPHLTHVIAAARIASRDNAF